MEVLQIIRDSIAIITLPLILYRIWILRYKFTKDHFVLENFRSTFTTESYPGISDFVTELKKTNLKP